jgi:hypothetical protein
MADNYKARVLPSQASGMGASGVERPTSPNDPLAELARLIGQDDLFEQMRRDAARTERGSARTASPVEEAPAAASTARAPAPDLRGTYDPHADEPRADVPQRERTTEAYSGYGSGRSAATYRQPATAAALSAYHNDPRAARDNSYAAESRAAPAAPSNAARSYATPVAADQRHSEAPAYEQHSQAYADEAAYDPAVDDYQYDDPAYADEQPQVAPRRRGKMMAVAAVLGLAVVGTAGAFAYKAMSGGENGSQPPVIKANNSPAKIAGTPQGRDAGRSGYDRSDKTQPERMVSREEQPLEMREARSPTPRAMPTGGGVPGMTAVSGQPAAAFAPTAGPASPISTEPKKVKTQTILPDGSVAPGSSPRSQSTGSIPRVAAATPATAPRTATPRAAGQTPMALGTQAAPPETARPAAAGSHVVQVSSQKTEEDAQASFRSLQAKYPTVLGNRQALIRKHDLGERGTFYRVQVGPFVTAEQATEMCGNLKAAGGQCIVQRN